MSNYSLEHLRYLKKEKQKKTVKLTLQISIFVLFFALWELLARFEIINPFIFSSPSRCVRMLGTLYKTGLLSHVGITLFETLAGFIIGSVAGFVIAVLLWWSPMAKQVLDPYLVILNSLPKIALGPLIIVWVGAGISSIITVTLLISIVVAIMGVLNGFNEVEQGKITLLKTLGATKTQTFFKVVFPASIPTTVSVLKLNIGMSWVGVIVGEFLNSKAGLGYLIVYGGQVFKMDIVMAATLVLCALSAGMYFLVVALEKAILKKRI
ncbi:MAG: ABC transporter permease [Clostridia bacterium]|nr:ABC transporter permease [Clostridia bacterium]